MARLTDLHRQQPTSFSLWKIENNKGQATFNTMLSNLSELQTITLSHGRFSKRCISNISENLLQKLMETLISSHSSLYYIIFNLLYSYVIVEGLCGAWTVKNNPSKTYIPDIFKLRERSIGIIETRQKGHGK
jgi:hypothetical protein